MPFSELQRGSCMRLFEQLKSFFSEDVPFSQVDEHSTLATLLDRIDLSERYGEKSYKAQMLEADRVFAAHK